MSNSDRKYVDHPAPGVGLMALLFVSIFGLLAIIPAVLRPSAPQTSAAAWAVILLPLAILAFYFWPLFSTYYTVSAAGLEVRYGPWKRLYPWSDFATAYWQKGMFATRIGCPGIDGGIDSLSPCARSS